MATTFAIGTFCLLVSCLFSLSTGGIISKTIYVSKIKFIGNNIEIISNWFLFLHKFRNSYIISLLRFYYWLHLYTCWLNCKTIKVIIVFIRPILQLELSALSMFCYTFGLHWLLEKLTVAFKWNALWRKNEKQYIILKLSQILRNFFFFFDQ